MFKFNILMVVITVIIIVVFLILGYRKSKIKAGLKTLYFESERTEKGNLIVTFLTSVFAIVLVKGNGFNIIESINNSGVSLLLLGVGIVASFTRSLSRVGVYENGILYRNKEIKWNDIKDYKWDKKHIGELVINGKYFIIFNEELINDVDKFISQKRKYSK